MVLEGAGEQQQAELGLLPWQGDLPVSKRFRTGVVLGAHPVPGWDTAGK